MKEKKPLLFIQSPVIQAFCPPPKEESTSLFELVRTPAAKKVAVIQKPLDESIAARLEFLHHPFRRQIYCPLEIIAEGQTIKGKIHSLEKNVLWIEQGNQLASVELNRIEDIKWKQRSFIL